MPQLAKLPAAQNANCPNAGYSGLFAGWDLPRTVYSAPSQPQDANTLVSGHLENAIP